jgi:Ca2+-binding EF-hand superfamily protein
VHWVGFLEASELHQLMIGMGYELAEPEMHDLMSSIDLDGDGKASESEFVSILKSHSSNSHVQVLARSRLRTGGDES